MVPILLCRKFYNEMKPTLNVKKIYPKHYIVFKIHPEEVSTQQTHDIPAEYNLQLKCRLISALFSRMSFSSDFCIVHWNRQGVIDILSKG